LLSPGGSGYFTYIQNMKLITTKFKSGGLHEKHIVATRNLGNHLSSCFSAQGNQEKPVSRSPVAGPSEYWLLASSPASTVKIQQCTHSTKYTHKMATIHTRQLQQYTRPTNNNYTQDNLKLATIFLYFGETQVRFSTQDRISWLSNLEFSVVSRGRPF